MFLLVLDRYREIRTTDPDFFAAFEMLLNKLWIATLTTNTFLLGSMHVKTVTKSQEKKQIFNSNILYSIIWQGSSGSGRPFNNGFSGSVSGSATLVKETRQDY
jgi:hypothetical protein